MRRKIRKVLSGLLIPVMAAAAMLSGIPAYGEVPEEEEKVELYRYITFYDSAGGDINDTVGYHVREVTGTVCGDFIEAPVNDSPDTIDLQETDGYPRVIVNYAMNQGRQTDITEKCFYDKNSGRIRIPAEYRGEFLTVKSVMSDFSAAYRLLVPEEYRVSRNIPAPRLTYEDGPSDDTDWAVYGVVDGSCNDTAANGDISGYQAGDRIEITGALVQTVARDTEDEEGTMDLYGELGVSDYRSGFGWTGFAVSLDCGENSPFTNIGNQGTGNSVRTFPGRGQVALNSRRWMYARCVTDDTDNFSGNGKFTGGHIKVIGKAADGTLTCWMYLERTGPDGQAAQNVGMVFRVHPSDGSLEIRKSSALPQLTDGNACYSLEGAEYTVYHAGTSEEAGKIVTDANGYGYLDSLPAGTYDIVETRAPEGYLLDSGRHTITVNAGSASVYSCEDMPGSDPVRILLVKQDVETGAAQADARLEGAEYTVRYYDGSYSCDPAAEGRKAKYEWVFRTDKDGVICFSEEYRVSGDGLILGTEGVPVLPVGTLTIQETKAPEGYLLNQTVYVANTLVQEGSSVVTLNLPNSETCMAEEKIIRGDMEFMKVDAGDRSAMAGIPFDLISKTTGERHRILTDENGYYSTAAAYAPHTRNTNAGTSPSDGIWFGAGEPDNKLGALPYDTYILEEKPCAANAGKDLAVLEFTVSRNNFTVNLGSICNYTVELHTEAKDTATGTKTVAPSAEASVTDAVTYRNLTVGRQYRITGQLILKETGEPLVSDGVPVVAETEFVPESRDGTVEVVFHFDASDLKGQALVAYEYLTWNGIPVASHEDPDDTDQTVYIPEISTTAYDRDTGSRTGRVQKDAVIEDTIEYRGLTPGKSYRLSGVLMDRDAGEPLLVNGKEVRASRSFVPDAPDGTVCMLFRFDASGLAGRTVVAFESVSYENTEVAVHADLEDENQSVHYPELRTKALDGNTGTHMGILSANASIKDTVFYENLIPGQEYVIRGSLVRKGTGEALTADGNPVMSEQAFTAGQPSGAVTLTYELDSRELAGQTAVVYEELSCGGMAVSGHKDPEDENQSIHYPAVGTMALDGRTGSHAGTAEEKAVIEDTVSYVNLVPGQKYVIRGKLLDKETGKALTAGGELISAEREFTPESPSGIVMLTYELDSRELAGRTAAVYEELFCGETMLASHGGPEDENQCVHYPAIRTSAVDGKTGARLGAAGKETVITDTVAYRNLVPGCEYTVRGWLMVKETGQEFLMGEEPVVAETAFTAEASSGTVALTYELDSTGLEGRTLVVFEELLYGNTVLTSHEDPEDEAQSVRYPKLRTEAAVQGEHETEAAGTVKITDRVFYENLIPGKTYTLKAALMNQETGRALTAGGMEITAVHSFTAAASSGTEEICLEFPADGLGGIRAVVFEELYYGNALVGTHSDLGDESQTVTLKHPQKERTTGAETGDPSDIPRMGAVCLGAGGLAVCLLGLKKKKDNGNFPMQKKL